MVSPPRETPRLVQARADEWAGKAAIAAEENAGKALELQAETARQQNVLMQNLFDKLKSDPKAVNDQKKASLDKMLADGKIDQPRYNVFHDKILESWMSASG